jgi:hypothetical protein
MEDRNLDIINLESEVLTGLLQMLMLEKFILININPSSMKEHYN